jgi:hypothetical protein
MLIDKTQGGPGLDFQTWETTNLWKGAPGPSHLGTWEITNPKRAKSGQLAPPQVAVGPTAGGPVN